MSTNFDREARDCLESAISTLVLITPLYGTVFLYLNKIERTDLPTMAVGTTRRVDLALYYNPEFVKKLTYAQLRAVLKHEALHVLLHHISRTQYFNYNVKGYNYAADMAINCHIEGLPPGALYPKAFGLLDNESSEWYYAKLKEESEKNGGNGEPGDGNGDLVDDHSMWGDCDDDIIKEKVRGIAESAMKSQESKGYGDISGNLVQQIIAANKAVVNWRKEVRYFVAKLIAMKRQSTRMRPNRRFGYQNPGSKRDYYAKILVAIDTSGSVSDQLLAYFLTELNGMITHVKVDMMQFDHAVQVPPTPYTKKKVKVAFSGRGGTCFNIPLDCAVENHYDGVVIFSDMQCSFPPKPHNLRILWAATEQNKSDLVAVPYGKKVLIEKKKS